MGTIRPAPSLIPGQLRVNGMIPRAMATKISLWFLTIASPAILLALLLGTPTSEWAFAVLAAAFPILLIALGAGRDAGALRYGLVALLVFYEACLLGVLALHGRDAPWLFGLPLATALQLVGVLLAPIPAVGLLYAWTFERHGLRRRDLEELRARFRGGKEDA